MSELGAVNFETDLPESNQGVSVFGELPIVDIESGYEYDDEGSVTNHLNNEFVDTSFLTAEAGRGEAPETDDAGDYKVFGDSYGSKESYTEISEPLAPDAAIPKDMYHALHPVGRYTARSRLADIIRAGESARIPTGVFERTTFTKGSEDWVTNQTTSEYRQSIFADQAEDTAPETANIAGGEDGAFAAGRTVLDVGSGEAVALLQYAERYPDTVFIGADSHYTQTREIDLTQPGVQLTHDDWHTLENIPTSSIDTVLSQRAVVPWGISPDAPGSPQVVDAITRVAKPGAVWRFDVTPDADYPHGQLEVFVTGLLEARGWGVTRVIDKQGRPQTTIVAINKV